MYPTISHFIEDLFGVFIPLPIQTFGFFVALAFLIASWTLSLELKRKEEEGILKVFIQDKIVGQKATTWQLLSAAIIGFFIGFKLIEAVFHYNDLVANPQDFILSSRGHFVGGVLGAIVSSFTKYRDFAKKALHKPKKIKEKIHPNEIVGNITMLAAVAGLLGAKIFHNLENIDAFFADPVGQLLSFSGLTFYGGLICGAAVVIWYGKKFNIHYTHIADAAAPGLMLAYGIGRLGCHFAGDGCWGEINSCDMPEQISFLPNWIWHYDYKNAVVGPPDGLVYPTAIYESIMAFLLFSFLWIIRKKITIPGMLFGIYLVVNGIERFIIEKIRVNTTYNIFGHEITQAEIISFLLIITGLSIVINLRRLKK